MTQTLHLEIDRPLTDEERQDVQAYVRSLVAKRNAAQAAPPKYVDVDAIRGMFAGTGGDESDKQFVGTALRTVPRATV
jgi:hypothetical protein